MSLYNNSNGSIKSKNSISVGGIANYKPSDKKKTITVLGLWPTLFIPFVRGSCFLLSIFWWERKDLSFLTRKRLQT